MYDLLTNYPNAWKNIDIVKLSVEFTQFYFLY